MVREPSDQSALSDRLGRLKYYVGPIAWMAVIFVFSTEIGSMGQTNSILAPMIKFVVPDISRRDLVTALITIRKIGHLVEYAVLSILWFYALQQGKAERMSGAVLGALVISMIYALLDEFHQSFVLSRTASVQDVGIDSIGALLGQVLLGRKGASQFFSSIKAKFFGWWFAWGVFSTIMVLIVIKGGNLSFGKMVFLTLTAGLLSGAVGVLYYVRQR